MEHKMVSLGTDNLVAANIHLTLSTWKRFVTATKTPIVYVEHRVLFTIDNPCCRDKQTLDAGNKMLLS